MTLIIFRHAADDDMVWPAFFNNLTDADAYVLKHAIELWEDLAPKEEMPDDGSEIVRKFYRSENSGNVFEVLEDIEADFP